MEYKISVQKERASYWMKELGSHVEVVNEDETWAQLKVTIESAGDILSIFHAGVVRGLDTAFEMNKTQQP